MKSLHKKGIKERCKELFARIGGVKNIEIIIAAILAVIAIIVYISISFSAKKASSGSASMIMSEMTGNEKRLSEMISRIDGIGECVTLINTGQNKEVVGVIVVAEGANDISKTVQIIRCVEIATGATVDRIQVYQMANGG